MRAEGQTRLCIDVKGRTDIFVHKKGKQKIRVRYTYKNDYNETLESIDDKENRLKEK